MREKYSSSACSISFLARVGARAGSAASCAGELFGLRRDVFRDEHDVVLELPFRRTGGLLVVGGDAVLHERGLPLVGDDQRPQEEQALLRIEEEHGIGFREARRIGQGEGLAPFACGVVPARGVDQDIVGGALAGAVEPADQQVAVGQFDDRGGVVALLTQP